MAKQLYLKVGPKYVPHVARHLVIIQMTIGIKADRQHLTLS